MITHPGRRLAFFYFVARDVMPWADVRSIVRQQNEIRLGPVTEDQRWNLLLHACSDNLHGTKDEANRIVWRLWNVDAQWWRPDYSPAGFALARELLDEWESGARAVTDAKP